MESENEAAINWFKNNPMILNPGKFQARIFDKRKRNHTNQVININQKEIKAVSKVKLLGIDIDVKLKYNHHIKNICKSVSNQLNALIKLKHLLRFEERKMLGNTFAMSNFSCYPLLWTFSKSRTYRKELYPS